MTALDLDFPRSYCAPVKVRFGCGIRKNALELVRDKSVLFVTSKGGRDRLSEDAILGSLGTLCRPTWFDTVEENPGINETMLAIEPISEKNFDFILAFGGGSVVDTAKILSVLLHAENRDIDLQSWVQDPMSMPDRLSIPVIALPTTAGTGSEVTPFATIWDKERQLKQSLGNENMYPEVALIDPELLRSVPQDVLESTALDAFNQSLESLWSKSSNLVSSALAGNGVRLGYATLCEMPNLENRESLLVPLSISSLLSGLAISQTRTALCHAISYPLTAKYGVPHGIAVAFTMPSVCRFNREVDDGRLAEVENVLGIRSLPVALRLLIGNLGVVERVKALVPDLHSLLELAGEMSHPGRADNNLRSASLDDIRNILEESWNEK